MDYLIDTQILIWSLVSPDKLSATGRRALQEGTIYVSVVSLLEIAIKQKVNKLPDLPVTTDELVEQLKRDGFDLLPLSIRHIARYNDIRLLLATALAERVPLISADEHFSYYTDQVTIVW
ncbi:PIN domain-containing protein [Fibrisoma montanum]|uniref:PIN domain-containing protein n=1 Tax=Fibrisoma montanum TaxID=2305895 RepID=A0A418LZ27_9BACT|nr:type II toxin-antitoxin system VapC family toxin [Fibrisoma montanum]RIV18482.1 PIN domain-containing protein [Fibrisoma montanum]